MDPEEQIETKDALAESTAEAIEFGQQLWAFLTDTAEVLLRPWNAYQLGIAAGLFLIAALLARPIAASFHDWLRGRARMAKVADPGRACGA